MIVCIDAGHGGKDPGATYKHLIEKDLNLILAEEIAKAIRIDGTHIAILTRAADVHTTNTTRIEYANRMKAHVFISIHHNASSSHKANGVEILHCPHSRIGIKMASALCNKICKNWFIKCRGVKLGYYRGDKSKGVLSVLKKTKMPAILLEAFFIDGNIDYGKFTDVMYRDTYYELIAKSILEVLNELAK